MLKIKDLHAGLEDKKILKGIDLEMKPGEIHAIMGPNGSGKSTLAAVITGKEDFEVTQGKILFEGEDLDDLSPEERAHRGIFLSFQYPVEIPGVTVTNFMKTAINEAFNMLVGGPRRILIARPESNQVTSTNNQGVLTALTRSARQCFGRTIPTRCPCC